MSPDPELIKTLDLANGIFEFGGAMVIWMNVARLKKDRQIRGVDWRVTAWFTLWGFFNLILYPMLGMKWSAIAGAILCLGNLVWVSQAIYYIRQERKAAC